MKARLVEPHDWPHQVKFMPPMMAPATSSGSASGKAISAFLPPSSDLLMDESAARGAARLATPGEIHAADDGTGDLVRVGVGKSDQCVLAAELRSSHG